MARDLNTGPVRQTENHSPASFLYSQERGASALQVTDAFLDCSTSGPTWFTSFIRNKEFEYPLKHKSEFVPA